MYYPLVFGAGLVYYIGMVQPKTPPLSIRPGDERLARIDAHAAKLGLTRHAAALELIDMGLKAYGPGLPSPAEQARIKAAVAKRQASSVAPKFRGVTASGEALPERGAYQKKGAKK